ncbi:MULTISPECIES: hypothetical protein [Rhodopseudomonas]|uniref:Transmembrane protein n=1 Tax=Rhodopseudomonas palustris TaxID=1076 RepID=A0A0D7EYL2_RHOPL|nr:MULTISPECIES: hypothetical protein [Rhodopseudomonas]KIZ45665.1 hypothetical protein OO17_07550 [Rhodopseudomonas palustris]MDF3811673.1 hypothetical protein [Rhodopseudomonas sp. BAL398]WOK19632.1 hypothetical protein RBJ75_09000 [Rhodopseudomonas sp. BAL398]
MTLLTPAHTIRRRRKARRGQRVSILLASLLTASSIGLIIYLLWPTWHAQSTDLPYRTPVSVGDTLFNVPTEAFRVKLQKHSGPQERVDLSFQYPSLAAADRPRHVSAATVERNPEAIDRIFLSIEAHHDALSPETRLRTIYPRYLAEDNAPATDGLTQQAFRDGSPYANEDLFTATAPELTARCTRDGATPGMCLSENRIGGADLIFRFPRQWLTQWRGVAGAIDRLSRQLHAQHD